MLQYRWTNIVNYKDDPTTQLITSLTATFTFQSLDSARRPTMPRFLDSLFRRSVQKATGKDASGDDKYKRNPT